MDIVSLRDDVTTINVAAGERRRYTQLAHIFGQSMTDNLVIGGLTDTAQRKVCLIFPLRLSIARFACQLAWATSSADVVERFTDISIVKELDQNSIHKPENTFTISPEFHGPFDELQFSLHPVGPVSKLLNSPPLAPLNTRSV